MRCERFLSVKAYRENPREELSEDAISGDLQNHFSEILALQQEPVRLGGAFHGQDVSNYRTQMSL